MAESTADSIARETRAAFADEAVELLRNVEIALNELSVTSGAARDAFWLEMLRALHTLKGAAAVVGAAALGQDVHALEEYVRSLQKGEEDLDARVMERLSGLVERVHLGVKQVVHEAEAAGALVVDSAPAQVDNAAARAPAGEFLRLRPEKIEALQTLAGELAVCRLQYEALSKRLLEVRDRTAEAGGAFRLVSSLWTQSRGRIGADQGRDLEIKMRALSAALPSVAEELAVVVGELTALAAQAAVVSTNLEDGIHALRLTPLQPFLEEYAKVVRETAREGRKEARLSIFAEGVEIDRAVLMRLRDPLLHLVRNAVVHGIEAPEHRASMGKAACGTVRLEGRSEGTRVIVEIIDDGRGIDVERVRQRALRMKLVEANDRLGDEQILDVLTHPGFSTQEVADGLAGRGIGLDVVATSVRDLDGQLQLSTRPGGGTTFTIDVPITASTGAGLIVRVEDHSFGILLGHVERVLRIGPADILSLEGREIVVVFGVPVAVVHLGDLVGVEGSLKKAPKRPAVVLRHGKQRLVLVVDDIPGDQSFVVRPLCRAFSGAHSFLGAAIQSDGAILPILQVAALFQRAMGAAPGRASRGLGVEATRGKDEISILVVDDSITMRTLLRNILHAAHYKVAVAHDGPSALSVLEGLPECHLIITDLQMPRMHGADLCRAVRRSARSTIPIIAVTSIGDDTERRRALAAGADAYIVKSDFEQDHFLSLVARFTGTRGASA